MYTLDALGPVPYRQLLDTLLVLPAAELPRRYFAVAPVLGNRVAERGPTQSLPDAGVGCYVQTLLAQAPVADTARLVLTLGTLYGVQSVQLQRLTDGSFQPVQTLSPPRQATTVFTDLAARPGVNQYRVLGQTSGGRQFVSDTVAVQLVRTGELLVFPVPATVGQELQVAGQPGAVLHITLYDALGRRVRSIEASGALNPLPTSGLRAGVYLLRATPTGGAPLTRRIVLIE